MLTLVTALLKGRTPLATWPPEALCALSLALDMRGLGAAETWKVLALRRHLFGGDFDGPLPAELTSAPGGVPDRRAAERLREGIPRLSALRCARWTLSVP